MLPYEDSDFFHGKVLANPIPYRVTWLTSDAACHVSLIQDGDRLIEPEKLDERTRISVWVCAPPAYSRELRTIEARPDSHHSPPTGQNVTRRDNMAIGNNERRAIEHLAV